MPVGNARATRGDGPDLSRWPTLVHAPQQWGDFVACHSNGTPAAEVARFVEQSPAGTTTQQVADHFGVSLQEVYQCLDYMREQA